MSLEYVLHLIVVTNNEHVTMYIDITNWKLVIPGKLLQALLKTDLHDVSDNETNGRNQTLFI